MHLVALSLFVTKCCDRYFWEPELEREPLPSFTAKVCDPDILRLSHCYVLSQGQSFHMFVALGTLGPNSPAMQDVQDAYDSWEAIPGV